MSSHGFGALSHVSARSSLRLQAYPRGAPWRYSPLKASRTADILQRVVPRDPTTDNLNVFRENCVASGVRFDGVWKKFRRGEIHDSLRDLIPAVARHFVRPDLRPPLSEQEFWAVRDVSFDVGMGHALGIIGPNGAGKSTILKLLTKILRPDRGIREVHGRMGMLIEIAAGFHPDLTGRENVFLQGAIMGMKRVEIARKFNEIVEFSEIEDFIDTPVKRYSSGMNARLGFAIAGHVDRPTFSSSMRCSPSEISASRTRPSAASKRCVRAAYPLYL